MFFGYVLQIYFSFRLKIPNLTHFHKSICHNFFLSFFCPGSYHAVVLCVLPVRLCPGVSADMRAPR